MALLTSTVLSYFVASNVAATSQEDVITVAYPYYAFVENPEDPWETVWEALDATDTVEYSDSYF